MNLRLTKKLEPQTSEQLLFLIKKLNYLRNLDDGSYLKAAFSKKIPVWKVPTSYKENLLTLEIAPLDSKRKFNLIKENEDGVPRFDENRETVKKITFEMDLLANTYPEPCTSLYLSVDSGIYSLKDFSLDSVFGYNRGNIFALAAFFSERFSEYQKIHAFLLEKGSLLKSQVSEEYVAALIELFSIEKKPIPGKAYVISKSFSKEETYYGPLLPIEKNAMFWVEFKYLSGKINQELDIFVSLTELGELIYDIIPFYSSEVSLVDKQIVNFINKNTKYFLEEMRNVVAFASKIVEIPDVRRKILISNL